MDSPLKKLKSIFSPETPILDDARYIAVATGRIEPYLRALSQSRCWQTPTQIQVTVDNLQFLVLWSSPKRIEHNLGKALETNLNSVLSIVQKQDLAGIVIDYRLPTELYIENKYLHGLQLLHAGEPTSAAFCPIAHEKLDVSIFSPRNLKNSTNTSAYLSAVNHVPNEIHLVLLKAQLLGIAGKTWFLVFPLTVDGKYASFDEKSVKALNSLPTDFVVVHPEISENWVLEYLDEYLQLAKLGIIEV